MKIYVKIILLMLTIFIVGGAGADEPKRVDSPPSLALGIDDSAVTEYGVRARVSARLLDTVKFSARDLLATFSEPQNTIESTFQSPAGGFNSFLDPGYSTGTASAGGLRTTPLQTMWSWRTDTCGGNDMDCPADRPWNGSLAPRFHFLATRAPGEPGSYCNRNDIVVPEHCGNSAHPNVAGGVLCNQRGFPEHFQTGFQREHGFYATTDDQCYVVQTQCMHNDGSGWCMMDKCTDHQFNELGKLCTLDPLVEDPAGEIYLNAAVFIFPNGFVENAGAGGAWSLPEWQRPNTLRIDAPGDFFGWVPQRRYGTYTGGSGNAGRVGFPGYNPHGWRISPSGDGGTWAAGRFPANNADYDESRAYGEIVGSYFRPGDDIAFYQDVGQMQIHSIDRDEDSILGTGDPDAVAGCGKLPVFTGEVNDDGEPMYFYGRVPQCLRPKSYWSYSEKKWVACDPYDTYLPNGNLNPARDDDRRIYPGGDGEPTCGAQMAGEPLLPFSSGGQRTGWSALYFEQFDLNTTDDKLDLRIRGNEWRLEMAIFFDFGTECTIGVSFLSASCTGRPGHQVNRKWGTGTLMIEDVIIEGDARLYSIDSHSCTEGGGCQEPWQPVTDGKVRPDRFRIDLNLTDVQVNMYEGNQGRNRFRAVYQDLTRVGDSCYREVYDMCVFRLASGSAEGGRIMELITQEFQPAFEDQFRGILEDAIEGLNTDLPNLGAIFGDPWNFGNSMVDVGLFLAGSADDAVPDPKDSSRSIWPIEFMAAPEDRDPIININGAMGFRPIAFKYPPTGDGLYLVDDPDNLDPTSIFGVPTRVYPDTSGCADCTRNLFPQLVSEEYDFGDYIVAGGSNWTDNKTGKTYSAQEVIEPYWMDPIEKAPEWCMLPTRSEEELAAMSTLFPMKTWLSFDDGETPPAGFDASQSLSDPATHTLGSWDYITTQATGDIGDPAEEQFSWSDAGLDAAASAKNGWATTTEKVSNANQGRAFIATEGAGGLIVPFTTQAPSHSYNIWVAQSRVSVGDIDPAEEQISRSASAIWSSRSAGGNWQMISTSQVSNANQGEALRAGETTNDLITSITTQAASAAYNVWIAHSRIYEPRDPTPESEQISMNHVDVGNAATSNQFGLASYTGANKGQLWRTGSGAGDVSLYMDVTIQGNNTYRLWTAARRWNESCGTFCSRGSARWRVYVNGTLIDDIASLNQAWEWRDHGTVELTAGTHQIRLRCGAGNAVRCLLDGFLLTTEATNPNTDDNYTPYAEADWDAVFLNWYHPYDDGTRPAVDTELTVRMNGSPVGTAVQTEDNTWQWTKVGTRSLTEGTHGLTFSCSAGGNHRCGLDGVLVTTEDIDPNAGSSGFTPYSSADWDAGALQFFTPASGDIVDTRLRLNLDGSAVGNVLQTQDNNWSWVKLGTQSLVAGSHTLTFSCTAGENNACGLDGLLITTEDINPNTAGGFTPYSSANWDAGPLTYYVPPREPAPEDMGEIRGVIRQNQNDPKRMELGQVNYDASFHIHQRLLNQFSHAFISSGAGCLEFGPTDPETGEATPWADFMTTERFAAFIPEIQIQWPNAPVKVRLAPQRSPRIRTGHGNVSYSPSLPGNPAISNEPYTLAVAMPDMELSFVVHDTETDTDITVLRMNWNAVLGLYMRFMRQCHQTLDPDRDDESCNSIDPLVRTHSGYVQLYLDFNNPDLGATFEAPQNTLDGFPEGRFTRSEFSCMGDDCVVGVPSGEAKFEVLEAYCGQGCDMVGLANSIPVLMDSTIQLYLTMRASTADVLLPFDFLYFGPDGPNDDGLADTSFYGSRGDYLGLYIRMLGDLNLGEMAGDLMAPQATMLPQATVEQHGETLYVNTNEPSFDVLLNGMAPGSEGESTLYSYRLNKGFWRTPQANPEVQLPLLTEGRHTLELRGVAGSPMNSTNQLRPSVIEFIVDTLPPEVSIPPARNGVYRRSVPVEAHDLQTPREQLKMAYSLNGDAWQSFEGTKVPIRSLDKGRHTLRVSATDLAGNRATTARDIVVESSWWSCSSGPDDPRGVLWLMLFVFGAVALSKRMRRN